VGLRFAFLVLKEHPYGREMLRILLEQGFLPGLVIEEASALADEERAKFLTRIAGQPVPPTFAELLADKDVPRREVGNHNDLASRSYLAAFSPELVVLGGTRILKPDILAVPRLGTVNAHPGLLPWLRGSSSVAWALYKDLPVGSTTHLLDANIDTGPIILQRHLHVYRGDTYEQLVRRMLSLSGQLMAETLGMYGAGTVEAVPQDLNTGETLRVIPPDLLEQAKDNLAQGRYSHFADMGETSGRDSI
jgi:folate-dependent phosphoribosylglycinamide formyltransferase PurN